MNRTDQYLIALTHLLRQNMNDIDLSQEWFEVCIDNAQRFSRSIQRGLPIVRDHEDVSHDATTSLWENLFIKGHVVRKSVTTMLFYRVKHFALYRRKKDFDTSYEAIIEEYGEIDIYGDLQSMQKNNSNWNILPRSSVRRERRTGVTAPPSCTKLPREARTVVPKLRMEKTIKRDPQLTLDL